MPARIPLFLASRQPTRRGGRRQPRVSPVAQWREAHYRFQLASDDAFRSPLLDAAQLEQPHLTLTEPLPSGQYFCRVAMHTTDEGQAPFCDTQRFRRPPPGPQPEPLRIGSDTLELKWRAAATEAIYQVPINGDATLTQAEVDRQTSQAMVFVDMPPAGVH